jgi:anti-repressor protein
MAATTMIANNAMITAATGMRKILSPDEKALKSVEDIRGRRATFISEPGPYKLAQASRKSEAKEFDRWVPHTILPAVRKDGGYSHGEVVKRATIAPSPVQSDR